VRRQNYAPRQSRLRLILQSPPDTLGIFGGRIARKQNPQGPSVTLGEVAKALNPGSKLLGDALPGLAADGWFDSAHMNYPYGIHFAVVRIDRTGAVAVERYFVAYDIGKAVNPMLVEGQIAGGVAQGLGGAQYEEFLYDPRGEPICVTLADYLMPTARDIPPIEVLISENAPSPLNSLGVKGAGEGGANAAGAAIAAAIDDALGRPGAVTRLPVTPQRLRTANIARNAAMISTLRLGRDEMRHFRRARQMEPMHALLHQPIGIGDALVLAQMLHPGLHQECLDHPACYGRIFEYAHA
jgi:CO/xanthine dehydrogenase Mo-binding subunit